MHKQAAKEVVEYCRRRVTGGDCSGLAPLGVEMLEETILELAKQQPMRLHFDNDWLRRGIERDGDIEPQAGKSGADSWPQ